MGFHGTRKQYLKEALDNYPEALRAHPNYQPPMSRVDESIVDFVLRCAADLVSPPQIEGESDFIECVSVAEEIRALAPAIKRELAERRKAVTE